MRNGWQKEKWVKVKYDPGNIESLLVIDDTGRTCTVYCTRPDYAKGLSLQQHIVIKRRAKKNAQVGVIRFGDLNRAKAELHEIAEKILLGRRKKGGLNRLARFLGIGREIIDDLTGRVTNEDQSKAHLDLLDEDVVDDDDGPKIPRAPKKRNGPENAAAEPVKPPVARLNIETSGQMSLFDDAQPLDEGQSVPPQRREPSDGSKTTVDKRPPPQGKHARSFVMRKLDTSYD